MHISLFNNCFNQADAVSPVVSVLLFSLNINYMFMGMTCQCIVDCSKNLQLRQIYKEGIVDFTILYYDGSKIIVKESSMKKYNKWTRKTAILMAAALAATGIPVTTEVQAGQTGPDDAAVNHLIINQVYGGNGKGDTPIANSFIELYNPTGADVFLEGYSIAVDNSSDNTIEKTITFTTGTKIGTGQSYLIIGQAESTSDTYLTYDLPEADLTVSDAKIDNKKYTISLKKCEDTVDEIAADADSAETNLNISKQKSLRRINYKDTDQNSDWQPVVWEKGKMDATAENLSQYAPQNSKGAYGNLHEAQQPEENPDAPSEPQKPTYTPVTAGSVKVEGFNNGKSSLDMEQIARYNSRALCADGGSLEIVEYNPVTGYAYAVSGLKGKIIAVKISDVTNADNITDLSGTEYDVKELVSTKEGFTYGDITSVAISPDGTKLAAAVQHADYATEGIVAVFDCKDDGSLENPQYFTVGVQPDMVTFADNDTILSADEGEPRNGFGTDTHDPKGSVSVISLTGKTSQQVYFNGFTAEELTAKNILIGKVNGEILSPEADLEPEYIAVSSDGKTAYVSLQEANAVAVLNIAEKKFTGIYSVGFEDYSQVPVDINSKDTQYEAKIYADIVGARMPDGIALYENAGKTYLVTANEGDSRVWAEKTPNEYSNETKDATITGKKITFLDPEKCAGLPNDKENEKVLYGGRSFTIFEVNADGLNEVYDSKDDFERITAEYIPDHFNCSNDNIDKDDRSGKKGPEPENVTIGTVNGKTYAFIAIERIGGIMVYDITDPAKAEFVNYINSREFASEIQGDVSPEGLCFVENQNGKITYTSAKQSVATVSQSGKITAQKSGNASITVTVTLKNGKTKVLNVMVKVK